jgi:ribonuclease HII
MSAINKAMADSIKELRLNPKDCFVKLDGSLEAPPEFTQETIIKGDQKELVIGLASILAKVTRDTYMCKQDKKFPQYGLAAHKGYGTKLHRDMIASHGFTSLHRKTYCKNIKIP